MELLKTQVSTSSDINKNYELGFFNKFNLLKATAIVEDRLKSRIQDNILQTLKIESINSTNLLEKIKNKAEFVYKILRPSLMNSIFKLIKEVAEDNTTLYIILEKLQLTQEFFNITQKEFQECTYLLKSIKETNTNCKSIFQKNEHELDISINITNSTKLKEILNAIYSIKFTETRQKFFKKYPEFEKKKKLKYIQKESLSSDVYEFGMEEAHIAIMIEKILRIRDMHTSDSDILLCQKAILIELLKTKCSYTTEIFKNFLLTPIIKENIIETLISLKTVLMAGHIHLTTNESKIIKAELTEQINFFTTKSEFLNFKIREILLEQAFKNIFEFSNKTTNLISIFEMIDLPVNTTIIKEPISTRISTILKALSKVNIKKQELIDKINEIMNMETNIKILPKQIVKQCFKTANESLENAITKKDKFSTKNTEILLPLTTTTKNFASFNIAEILTGIEFVRKIKTPERLEYDIMLESRRKVEEWLRSKSMENEIINEIFEIKQEDPDLSTNYKIRHAVSDSAILSSSIPLISNIEINRSLDNSKMFYTEFIKKSEHKKYAMLKTKPASFTEASTLYINNMEDMQQFNKKKEECLKKLNLKSETQKNARNFNIDFTENKFILKNISDTLINTEKSLKDVAFIQAINQIRYKECSNEDIQTINNFKQIVFKKSKNAFKEILLPLKKKVEECLIIKASKECNVIIDKIMQPIVSKNFTYKKTIKENLKNSVKLVLDPNKSEIEAKFYIKKQLDTKLKTNDKCNFLLKETPTKNLNFQSSFNIYDNELTTMKNLKDSEKSYLFFKTNAPKFEICMIEELIKENNLEIQTNQKYHLQENEVRSFSIDQNSIGKSFKNNKFIDDTSEKILKAIYKELPISRTLSETHDSTIDTAAFLCRILSSNKRNGCIENILNIPRKWSENICIHAYENIQTIKEIKFCNPEVFYQEKRILKDKHLEKIFKTTLASSLKTSNASSTCFSRNSIQKASSLCNINESTQENCSIWLREQKKSLKTLLTDLTTIERDLETEFVNNITPILYDSLNIKTSNKENIFTIHQMSNISEEKNSENSLDIKIKEEINRSFKITSSEVLQQFAKSGILLNTQGNLNQKNKNLSAELKINEESNISLEAGVLMVQFPLKKTHQTIDYVISIGQVFSQTLNTLSAKDVKIPNVNVEWKGNESNEIYIKTVKDQTIIANLLETDEAREEIIFQRDNFILNTNSKAECGKKIPISRREKSKERFLEFKEDDYEVLSEWTTVDRDLEVYTCIQTNINQYAKKNMLESVEEILNINENWEKGTFKAFAIKIYNITNISKVSNLFKISRINEFYELLKKNICLKIFIEKIFYIAHFAEPVDRELFEFEDKTLNTIIFLHCVNRNQLKPFSLVTLYEKTKISAIPLNIYVDSVNMQYTKEIIAPTTNKYNQRILKSINWGLPILKNLEESSNEFIKISINMLAKNQYYLNTEKIQKISNFLKLEAITIDEYEEDDCLLYAQLNTRDVKWLQRFILIDIKRIFVPSPLLICKSSGDYKVNINVQWNKSFNLQNTKTIILIPFAGQNIKKIVFECTEDLAQLSYIYDKKSSSEFCIIKWMDSRFGGCYVLKTNATSNEERKQTISLNKKQSCAFFRKKMPYCFKFEILSMRLIESFQENADISYNFERQQYSNFKNAICKFPREILPIKKKIKESTNVYVLINYELQDEKRKMYNISQTQSISQDGGNFILSTNAVENLILNALRELTKDEQFDFKEQIIIDFNKVLPIKYKTKASEIKSIELNNIWFHENELKCVQIIIKAKNVLPKYKINLKESKDINETSYYKYAKEVQIGFKALIWREIRFGGSLILKTETAQENNATFMRELESDHLQVAHCSKGFIYSYIANPIILFAKASGASDRLINAVIQKSEARERCSVSNCAPRETPGIFYLSVFESNEEIKRINCEYLQKQKVEILENVIIISRNGGNVIKSTLASGNKIIIKEFNFFKHIDCVVEPMYIIKCKRYIEPINLNISEFKYFEAIVRTQWVRKADIAHCAVLKKCQNMHLPALIKIKESMQYDELTNFQYFRPESNNEINILIWDKQFGGIFTFFTKSSIETNVNLSNGNIEKIKPYKSSLFSNSFIIDDIRWAEKILLNTKTSQNIIQSIIFNLHKIPQTEKNNLLQKAANESKADCRIKESQAHSETLNCNYKRLSEASTISYIVNEKGYGGNFILSCKKSGEVNTLLTKELIEDSLTSLINEHIVWINNQPVGTKPLYRCKASTSTDIVFSALLTSKNEKKKNEESIITIAINRILPAQHFNLHELLFSQECINCQYNKPFIILEITVIYNEPRFGAHLILSTNCSGEKTINTEATLTNSQANINKLETSQIIKITQEVTPTFLNLKASKSSNISTTTQLQRTEQRILTIPFKIIVANRFSNPPSIRVTETREIEQLNNVQFNYSEQFISPFDYTHWESRNGGHFFLKTSSSTEAYIYFRDEWKIEELNAMAPIHNIPIYNEGPLVPIFQCNGSSMKNVFISSDLNSNVVLKLESEIVLTEVNKGFSAQIRSVESTSINTTTNICLQSSKINSGKPEPLTIAYSRMGGNYNIYCKASGEIDSGEIIFSLHRPSFEASAVPFPFTIPIPTIGLAAILRGRYAEEATFNLDVVLTYQFNELNFEQIFKDIRRDSIITFESKEVKVENTVMNTTEVNQRLMEVQLETVVARPSCEILSIHLNIEYSRESIIRVDSTFDSLESKHIQELDYVWKDTQIIIVNKFHCEAVDLVRMRKSLLDTEKETKEKRLA